MHLQAECGERCFGAFGLRIGLRCQDVELFEEIRSQEIGASLPPGWHDVSGDGSDVAMRYDLRVSTSGTGLRTYHLSVGATSLADTPYFSVILRALGADAELAIAERSPDYLFVHAGVVAWGDVAVVLLGYSHAGKTTLVQAFLEAGATYYSDEYAVLDRAGWVHPYARPLSVEMSQ